MSAGAGLSLGASRWRRGSSWYLVHKIVPDVEEEYGSKPVAEGVREVDQPELAVEYNRVVLDNKRQDLCHNQRWAGLLHLHRPAFGGAHSGNAFLRGVL
jgi:hypothetical protein